MTIRGPSPVTTIPAVSPTLAIGEAAHPEGLLRPPDIALARGGVRVVEVKCVVNRIGVRGKDKKYCGERGDGEGPPGRRHYHSARPRGPWSDGKSIKN